MSILCAYVFLLLSICGSVSSFLIPNLPNFIRDGRAVELKYRRRADLLRRPVVEHLVDCASDPRLAELYGNGEVCIQNDWGGLISISGFVGQVATIGFLVMSYYFFKRTRGGILDWQDTEDDNDDYEDEGRDDSYDYFGDKRGATTAWNGGNIKNQKNARSVYAPQEMRMRRCPQCSGTGKFNWKDSQGQEICDVCIGAGSLAYPIKNSLKALPSARGEDLPMFTDDDDEA